MQTFEEAFERFVSKGVYPTRAERIRERARLATLDPAERKAVLLRRLDLVQAAIITVAPLQYRPWHASLLYERNLLEAALYQPGA